MERNDEVTVSGRRIIPRNAEDGNWCWAPNALFDFSCFGLIDALSLAVYLALAQHANRQGECWPSVRRLARMLGISRDTVRDRLYQLRDAELIFIRKRWLPNGRPSSNLYILLVPPMLERRMDVLWGARIVHPDEEAAASGAAASGADTSGAASSRAASSRADMSGADAYDDDDEMDDQIAQLSATRSPSATAATRKDGSRASESHRRHVSRASQRSMPGVRRPEGTVFSPISGDASEYPRRPERPSSGDAVGHIGRPGRPEQESVNQNQIDKKRNHVAVKKAENGNSNSSNTSPHREEFLAMGEADYVAWARERFRTRLSPKASTEETRSVESAARELWRKETPEWWDLALDAARKSGMPNARGVHHAVATAAATNAPPKAWSDRGQATRPPMPVKPK